MLYINVKSSSIELFGYDDKTEVLRVKFKRGVVYDYHGVDRSTFDEILNAKSVGSMFHCLIKKAGYEYKEVK